MSRMPDRGDAIRFVADRGDARLRLDQVVVRRVVDVSRLSRTRVQQWIEMGSISVNGSRATRSSARVAEGATVEIRLPSSVVLKARPAAEPHPLELLYEDADLIIVNKPAGIVVHPSFKQLSGTLLNAVLWHVRDRPAVRPGLLTRLDKDTTGIVVVALTPSTHATLQRDGTAGGVKKEYLALVHGLPRPPYGQILFPLAHDPADRRRIIVSDAGAPSETRYEVVQTRDGVALLRCELITGRTHQIRVHLAASGWPILGDRLYGEPHPRIGRQALHAARITLLHPRTREAIEIEAPLPPDMRALLESDEPLHPQ